MELLKKAVADQSHVFVKLDNEGKCKKVKLDQLYGCGGSKCAFKLDNKHALIIPNVRSALPAGVWRSVVHKEVGMSQWLRQHDLLTPVYQPATVYFSKDCSGPGVLAYYGVSFDAIRKKGIYIVERDSLPKEGSDLPQKIFDSSDPSVETWKCLLQGVMQDIPNMYRVGVKPAQMDAIHWVLIKSDSCPHTPYTMRYLGYDFSSKKMQPDTSFSQPPLNPIDKEHQSIFELDANSFLNMAIEDIAEIADIKEPYLLASELRDEVVRQSGLTVEEVELDEDDDFMDEFMSQFRGS